MTQYPIPALIYETIQSIRARAPHRPALIGISGAQGSGKTHWCKLLEATNRPRIAHFSLDDIYLTRAEREALAREVHPLFLTRGPPGTHDLDLADRTIAALEAAGPQTQTPLPRFDKARDDRAPESEWPRFAGKPEAILIDGWCVGALAPPEGPPLNAVEREDADGVWRAAISEALTVDYAPFFEAFDAILYLKAPSWEIVRAWRGEQEQKLLARPLTAEENAALDRFVMHYERLTRSMLDGKLTADWIVHLDETRAVTEIERR